MLPLANKVENIDRGRLRFQHPFTYTRLTALCPGLPGWAGTRKVRPVWILLKQSPRPPAAQLRTPTQGHRHIFVHLHTYDRLTAFDPGQPG